MAAVDALVPALDAAVLATGGGGGGGDPPAELPALIHALALALFHEEYDPRVRAADPAAKGQPDVELFMPFVAVVYGSLGIGPTDPARYADASNMQRLFSALLFATKITNTLYYMSQTDVPSVDSFAVISRKSDLSGLTAAAYIVYLSGMAERISSSETFQPVFLPCDDPAHVRPIDGGRLAAGQQPQQGRPVCGTLLGAELHMSTTQLGTRLAGLHASVFDRFRALTGGYDPAGSGFWADAVHLTDRPSAHAPGVGFLQLSQNGPLVGRWVDHFVTSGTLEAEGVPVRAVAGPAAAASAMAPPPAEVSPGANAAWQASAQQLRADLWAAMHIAGGAPARQTDDASVLVAESKARPRRNLFTHAGSIFTVLTYSKGLYRNAGEGRPVLRWMDAVTSTLVLLVLVFLDPLEAYVERATRVGGGGGNGGGRRRQGRGDGGGESGKRLAAAGEAPEEDLALLFRDARGRQLLPSVLNRGLEAGLLHGLQQAGRAYVGVRALRQFLAGVTKTTTGIDILHSDLGADGPAGGTDGVVAVLGRVLDAQAGHTSTTATQRYAGLEDLAVHRLTAASVFWFRQASHFWHQSIGVRSHHATDRLRHPLQPRPSAAVPGASAGGGAAAHATALRSATAAVGGALGSAAHLAVASPAEVAAASTTGSRTVRMLLAAAEAAMDAAARQVFGPGGFKYPTQRQAAVLKFSARDPVTQLTVLPTGGGKSASFFLPVYIEATAAANAAVQASSSAAARGGSGGGGRVGVVAAPLWSPPVTLVLTTT